MLPPSGSPNAVPFQVKRGPQTAAPDRRLAAVRSRSAAQPASRRCAGSATRLGWRVWPAGLEGQFDLKGGAASGRAVQPEVAAECFGPVLEPEQSGAVAEVCAAAP